MDIGFVARVLGAVEPRGVAPVPPSARDRVATEPEGERSSGFGRAAEVTLSGEAQALIASSPSSNEPSESRGEFAAEGRDGATQPGELTAEEQEEVTRLKERDAEVRAHENAHKAAAGQHARGGPTYEFERGPDGRRYAVGGEVQIDTSPVANDPDATILKMRQVRRAALAPAEPSPQDRRVASEASQQESAARREKLAEQQEEGAARKSNAYTRSAERPVGQALDLIA